MKVEQEKLRYLLVIISYTYILLKEIFLGQHKIITRTQETYTYTRILVMTLLVGIDTGERREVRVYTLRDKLSRRTFEHP